MYSYWQPASSASPWGWGTAPSKALDKWKPARPHAPGHKLIITKHPEGILVNNHPIKRINIVKRIPFDNIPMEILSNIYDWLTILRYSDNQITIFEQIKIPKIQCVSKLTHMNLKPYHNFGPL